MKLSRSWLCVALLGLFFSPLAADEKQGMPDLCQDDQTCLPTSTANLMIWFGHHGYPNLIRSGMSDDDRDLKTVHQIMAATNARFDWGTRMEKITSGIEKYVHESGYDCDVEFRGLQGNRSFSGDWLKENDDANKGFILLLAYCYYHPQSNSYSSALGCGHAVTLVNAQPDMLLIHDPAHYRDETGRKIITPQVLTSGAWQDAGLNAPVSGLMILSGSLLDAPPESVVLLTGAVCVTMHPIKGTGAPASPMPAAAPNSTLAGGDAPDAPAGGTGTPSSSGSHPATAPESWWVWLFNLAFTK